MICGIYQIRNRINGRAYFGSTIDWKTREYRHKLDLRKGVHHCQRLQRAWSKYGEHAFEFIFLREIAVEYLHFAEQLCFDLFPDKYNTGTYAGMAFLGRKHTEESKQKMRLASLGQVISQEQREKLRQASLGKPCSNEARKKISASLKGRSRPPHFRGKGYWLRANTWNIGLYWLKRKIYSAHCRSEEDAREVVKIVRSQVGRGDPIAVPPALIIKEINGRKKSRGYYFDSNAKRWKAFSNGRRGYLGSFLTEAEAAAAFRNRAEVSLVE